MKKYHFSLWSTIGLLTILSFTLFSCDDFVEVEIPNSQLVSEAVFQNKATAVAALTSVYAKMRDNGILTGSTSGFSHSLGLYADEMELFGSQAGPQAYFNNSLVANSPVIRQLWNASYNQIIGMVFTPSSDRCFMIYGANFWRNCALAVVTP